MKTPHIESDEKDIAKIVIMPGDPKRAEYIAKNYLEDSKLVNQVRGITAYTGYYQNKKITVFPSGMGIPSMGIYSHELFAFYNVDYIIRIGTMGSYTKELNVGEVFLATSSYSNSSYNKLGNNHARLLKSSSKLNKLIEETAKEEEIDIKTGRIFSSDIFYGDIPYQEIRDKYKVSGVEMESYGLIKEAMRNGKEATSILTVSDSFETRIELTSEEREKNLDNMIKLALKTSLKL